MTDHERQEIRARRRRAPADARRGVVAVPDDVHERCRKRRGGEKQGAGRSQRQPRRQEGSALRNERRREPDRKPVEGPDGDQRPQDGQRVAQAADRHVQSAERERFGAGPGDRDVHQYIDQNERQHHEPQPRTNRRPPLEADGSERLKRPQRGNDQGVHRVVIVGVDDDRRGETEKRRIGRTRQPFDPQQRQREQRQHPGVQKVDVAEDARLDEGRQREHPPCRQRRHQGSIGRWCCRRKDTPRQQESAEAVQRQPEDERGVVSGGHRAPRRDRKSEQRVRRRVCVQAQLRAEGRKQHRRSEDVRAVLDRIREPPDVPQGRGVVAKVVPGNRRRGVRNQAGGGPERGGGRQSDTGNTGEDGFSRHGGLGSLPFSLGHAVDSSIKRSARRPVGRCWRFQ